MKTIKVKLLSPNAKAPTRAHETDAGLDLYAADDAIVDVGDKEIISTGISVEIPPGYVGLVWPRSGLAVKSAIDTGAGVIDSAYRGEIKVLLFNHHIYSSLKINSGDKIAQLLIQPIETPVVQIVETLDETDRGANGFGSTGR